MLTPILKTAIRDGSLTLIDPHGQRIELGGNPFPASLPDPLPRPSTIRLHDPNFLWRFLKNPEIAAGEAYMDGTLTVDEGTLYDALGTLVHNLNRYSRHTRFFRWHWFLNRSFRWLHQHNPAKRSARNVAHHYNLSGDLYRLFLDGDRQYSCAYWTPQTSTLEEAQEAKKRHIAAKLCLEPGQRVLDIGCGWGGLAMHLAREHTVHVTGVTLSKEQFAVAQRRVREAGLESRVDIRLQDYRHVTDRFDRLVSVGMFEHVGVNHYDEFFRKTCDLLTQDGVFLLHTIGRAERPGGTNAWLRKYIFPGGYTPALSEVMEHVEHSDWVVNDVEVLRVHYADTLRHWRERFAAHRERVVNDLYDERFYRMWDFYLTGCEVVFRFDRQVVFQVQLSRTLGAVPQTRDYIGQAERMHQGLAAE